MLFQGDTKYHTYETLENTFTISEVEEIETPSGWVFAKDLKEQDLICLESDVVPIKQIKKQAKSIILVV